jgi:hypothetical protein
MPGRDMDLLNELRRVGWRVKAQIAAQRHLSTGSSSKTDNDKLFFPTCVDCPQDVRRAARCRDRDVSATAAAGARS